MTADFIEPVNTPSNPISLEATGKVRPDESQESAQKSEERIKAPEEQKVNREEQAEIEEKIDQEKRTQEKGFDVIA